MKKTKTDTIENNHQEQVSKTKSEKAEFTPGPWVIRSENGWDVVVPENQNLAVCKLVENNPANLALIAAAPDLLAVCQMVARTRKTDAWGNCVDAANAAIKKAMGE